MVDSKKKIVSSNYGDEDIEQLEGAVRIRKRPASMLGSDGIDGARHGLTEIIGNAVDEHNSGFGDTLEIHYYEDGSVSVRDYGRGVPLGWNESKKKWNWFLIFNELYAGGKYKDYQVELQEVEDKNGWEDFNPHSLNYFFAIGLNGLGAASTQYTSSFFEVESYRDGVCSKISFKHGQPVTDLEQMETEEANGTFIHWRPDEEVFSATNMGSDFIEANVNTVAYVSQMDVRHIDDTKGINKLVKAGNVTEMLKDVYSLKEGLTPWHVKKLHHGHTRVANKDFIYVFESEVAFSLVNNNLGGIIAHHNGVRMVGREDKNAHHVGINNALDTFFKRVSKDYGIKIKPVDYRTRFAFVVNGYSNTASYANQTKNLVDDPFIALGLQQDVERLLDIEYDKENPDILNLIQEIIEEIDIKQQLEEQKKILKQVTKSVNSRKTTTRRRVKKFMPSRGYINNKVAGTQLLIVEGDSAKGSVKDARDPETQSIYPIRGKIINALKQSEDKVLANNEVADLIQIIGGGIELPQIEQSFDLSKVKFEEVVILTDADKDGYQIRALLMILFFKFMPQLILEGRLFISETPIYELMYSNKESQFAYNEEDVDVIIKEHGSPIKMNRFKGLGSLDGETLAETAIDVNITKRKNLIPIQFDVTNPLYVSMIDSLLGADKFKNRRDIVINYLGKDVANMFEENNNLFEELDEDNFDGLEMEEVEM